MMTDRELLAEYSRSKSAAAFAEIVERHTTLVYSACIRVLEDPHAAEDAAQATFLLLAQRAPALSPRTILSGWLYLTAKNLAQRSRRAAQRRERHEREAAHMPPSSSANPHWDDIRPLIDDALAALPEAQRNAVVLRYLKGLSQADAARELACGEETLHTRLSRALNTLRQRLAHKGVAVSLALLTSELTQRSVDQVPAGLSATIKSVCAGQTAASVLVLELVGAGLRSIYWAKVKLACALAAALVILSVPGLLVLLSKADQGQALAAALPAAETGTPAQAPIAQRTYTLADRQMWSVRGDLPVTLTASEAQIGTRRAPEIVPATQRQPRAALQHHQTWDLSQGAVRFKLTLDLPAQPICALSLTAINAESLVEFGHPDYWALGLIYDGNEILVRNPTFKDYLPRRAVTYEWKPAPNALLGQTPLLRPGQHVFELTLSEKEVWTRIDGQTVYRGGYGKPARKACFGFELTVPEHTGNQKKVLISDVSLGPALRDYDF